MTGPLYLLFFCSGLSGLIYQVVWVRVFGNVFGNTVYSASLVIAVFMLGLGAGSYLVGVWADRRYAASLSAVVPDVEAALETRLYQATGSLLRVYGYFELIIATMGFGISMLLPHLDRISALVSSYSRDAGGWYVLSTTSYLARGAIAVILLTPITMLMGGTLTLLIRHLVRSDFEIGGWRIAVLYAVNTAGAALGCFLTDFALVPAWGLRNTQLVAVAFNAVAGIGALWLARFPAGFRLQASGSKRETTIKAQSLQPKAQSLQPKAYDQPVVVLTSLALAMSGFAAMGMEILWFRHFSILLGEFRAVFSLLLTVILIGIGAGSLAGGVLHRRTTRIRSVELRRGSPEPSAKAAHWLIVMQALFVVSTLLGLASADIGHIRDAVMAQSAYQGAAGGVVVESAWARLADELWFNARPILLEVGIPALLMGFAFPLANAVIQRAEPSVGRHAGVLYLANTVGAVGGSLAAGFLLLPTLGIQGSATILMIAAGLAVVPLYLAMTFVLRQAPDFASNASSGRRSLWRRWQDERPKTVRRQPFDVRAEHSRRPNAQDSPVEARIRPTRTSTAPLAGSLVITACAIGLWLLLPSDYMITRALVLPVEKDRLLTLSEGINEVIAVTEVPGEGRLLSTNGHPMSSTSRLSQRYMRALVHIPLLSIENPETVLVICFGVGNTAHAATLHPSVRRVEVVDLSRHVLAHSSYFQGTNGDVLNNRRVAVYVNDGRHHLQMQPEASYDLITLEPPPVTQAGVGALYSREFYALARTRLKPKGYISQWLPVARLPEETTLAMIRAFVEVFPHAVLVSGAHTNLLLIGTNDSHIEIDPVRVATALSNAPAVEADLQQLDLGSVREIVGTFVGSARTLAEASRDSAAVTDDRPILEYGVRSLLNFGDRPPASIVDVSQVAAWCPRCFVDGKPVPPVDGLDTYLALLNLAYTASPVVAAPPRPVSEGPRVIAGSAYLGAIIPESADLHNVLGSALAASGNFEEAIAEFREALRLDPDSATAHWNLGRALTSPEEAVDHLRRSLQLDPGNGQARYLLATTLLESRQYEDAADQFRAALRLMPNSVEAHNNLGVALASQGKLDEAIDQFQQALTIQPEFADARRNLTTALQQAQGASSSSTVRRGTPSTLSLPNGSRGNSARGRR